ncbi:SpoIIE family protein phosphatase [Pseudenhygromyxa sp. WMMC2535]|uniref:SpoIIE family protein phosphatase n=1 Tax=Pseudenhygromyxa sp. WMMC2535 TaxID=2712867 RepID=UPI0015535F71|nr:SpoIIE family protein phosphatase [Pseudenhygromyxa sp. WMMC2535]NVB38910.1 SpoIIE family protein phosphatase [Pseudenhygromyxa sp. WMMC2535]
MHVDARVFGRPRIGEEQSGDAGVVREVDAVTWVLLIDGLGHGPKAAAAAQLAVDELGQFDAALDIEAAFIRLNDALKGSRGAAATLVRFEERRLTIAGVGNVELRRLSGPQLPFMASNGVLGRRLPRLRVAEVEVDEPGRMLLFTDGIDRRAPLRELSRLDVDAMGRLLLAQHSHDNDDATAIHVDYRPS